jgi:ribose-phosphate pyrophosphokinase
LAGCLVVSGADEVSRGFAGSLATSLHAPVASVEGKVFPDGESYVRLPAEAVGAEWVCVVKTLAPPQDKSLVELLLTLDALREKSAGRVTAIVPYLAYSRQDREFLPNEAVSVRTVLRAIRCAGADELYTVEVHKEESLRFFGGRAFSVSPYELMARRIGLPEGRVAVIAPDRGAIGRARRFAEALGVSEVDYLVKHRDRVTGQVTFEPREVDVDGKDVVIVDDIISTGGTVAKAARILLTKGARRILVVVAHALMVGNAWERLVEAGVEKVYAANTVRPVAGEPVFIDVAPAVAERLGAEG